MSKKSEPVSEKAYVKKRIHSTPLWGSKLAALGAALLFAFAFSELNTRIDAIDGLLRVYFRAMPDFFSAVKGILQDPEARADMLKLLYLFIVAIAGLIGCAFSPSHRVSWVMIPVAVLCMVFSVQSGWLAIIINPLDYCRLIGGALLCMGSVFKLIQGGYRKHIARQKYYEKRRTGHSGSGSTLIPQRIQKKR